MSFWCCNNPNHPDDLICSNIYERPSCVPVVEPVAIPIGKDQGEKLLEEKERQLKERNVRPSSKDATELSHLLINLHYHTEASYSAKYALRKLAYAQNYQQLIENLNILAVALTKLTATGAADAQLQADIASGMAEKVTALAQELLTLKAYLAQKPSNK